MVKMHNAALKNIPDIMVSVRQLFGIDSDLQVPAFAQKLDGVPDLDEAYRFDKNTTLAILAGAGITAVCVTH